MNTTSARRGSRRVPQSVYKFLLTSHVIVSVGWLGVVLAKAVLGLTALNADPATAAALHGATRVIDSAFPFVAIGTIVSGIALSAGTRWGLVRHYWVAVKTLLTVGVISTAVGFGAVPLVTLFALAVAHLAMLVVATVLSTYKPWGKTRFGRAVAAQRKPAAISTGLPVH